MKPTKLQFAQVPAWIYTSATPGALTFFESIALAGLEEKPIRLTAETQRKLLGYPVFGRREITVSKAGEVKCLVSTGFGMDCETAIYSVAIVKQAAEQKKQLRPGTTGARYL